MPTQMVSMTAQGGSDMDAINRRMKMAEALQAQSLMPIQSAHPSAPIHFTQGLAKMLQAYQGARQMKQAEEERRSLVDRQEQRQSADMSLLAQKLLGREAQPAGLSEDASGNVTQRDAIPAQSPVQGLAQAIPLMGPQMQGPALNLMAGAQQRQDQREFQRQQAEEARQGRLAQFQLQSGEREESQRRQQEFLANQEKQRAADREALVRMQIEARPAPQRGAPVAVVGPDGKTPVYVTPDQAPGRQPWSPTVNGRDRPMTATAQRELIETEEGIQGGQAALSLFKQARDLNDQAMGFTGAGALASAGSLLPQAIRPGSVDATQNLDNILQTAALPQLKAIFGGMPTEGERKILLDVQGSSSKPPAVRKEIFDRAERAINARLKFGIEKVKRLREGTYFSGEGLPSIEMTDEPPPDHGDQNDRRAKGRTGRTVVVDY